MPIDYFDLHLKAKRFAALGFVVVAVVASCIRFQFVWYQLHAGQLDPLSHRASLKPQRTTSNPI